MALLWNADRIGYVAQIPKVLGSVLRSRDLRRVELAFVCFNAAEWGVWIAMLVHAYDPGGATTARIVALVQLVPAALFAPIAASLGDRHRPTRVLAAAYAAQAVAMGATAAVLLGGGSPFGAYGLAVIACVLIAGVGGPGPAGAAADTREALRAAA